jgi:hypothetical protein
MGSSKEFKEVKKNVQKSSKVAQKPKNPNHFFKLNHF